MNNRKFGIEIEAYGVDMHNVVQALRDAGIDASAPGYTHQTTSYWKAVTDGSLSGAHAFELVSPILEGEAGLESIKTVCGVLNSLGVKVNRSCGLHVHVDARDATQLQLGNLLKQWAKFEGNVMELLPPSRRENTYCRRLFSDLDTAFTSIDSQVRAGRIGAYASAYARYVTLNMQSIGRPRFSRVSLPQRHGKRREDLRLGQAGDAFTPTHSNGSASRSAALAGLNT